MFALKLDTECEGFVRAIVFQKDEDGFKSVADIAEAETLAELRAWFVDNWADCHYVILGPRSEFVEPGEITVWEAAEALYFGEDDGDAVGQMMGRNQ